MKTVYILAIFLLPTLCPAQKSENLSVAVDSTYGYSPDNPLKLKRGNPGKSTNFAISFLTQLETEDHQQMLLVRTSIIQDPRYEYPIRQLDFGRQTAFLNQSAPASLGTPMGDNLVDKGLLQEYTFMTTGRGDTLRLYVDIYHRDDVQIPIGLRLKNGDQ